MNHQKRKQTLIFRTLNNTQHSYCKLNFHYHWSNCIKIKFFGKINADILCELNHATRIEFTV